MTDCESPRYKKLREYAHRMFLNSLEIDVIVESLKCTQRVIKMRNKVKRLGWDNADVPVNIFQKLLGDSNE